MTRCLYWVGMEMDVTMFVAKQAAVIRDPEARRTQGHVVRKPKSIVRDQETRQLTKTSISLAYDENRRRPEGGGKKKVQPSPAAGKYLTHDWIISGVDGAGKAQDSVT